MSWMMLKTLNLDLLMAGTLISSLPHLGLTTLAIRSCLPGLIVLFTIYVTVI